MPFSRVSMNAHFTCVQMVVYNAKAKGCRVIARIAAGAAAICPERESALRVARRNLYRRSFVEKARLNRAGDDDGLGDAVCKKPD